MLIPIKIKGIPKINPMIVTHSAKPIMIKIKPIRQASIFPTTDKINPLTIAISLNGNKIKSLSILIHPL